MDARAYLRRLSCCAKRIKDEGFGWNNLPLLSARTRSAALDNLFHHHSSLRALELNILSTENSYQLGTIVAPQLESLDLYLNQNHIGNIVNLIKALDSDVFKRLAISVDHIEHGFDAFLASLERVLPKIQAISFKFEDYSEPLMETVQKHCRHLKHLRLNFRESIVSPERACTIREIIRNNTDTIECFDLLTRGTAVCLFPDTGVMSSCSLQQISQACLDFYGIPLLKFNRWRDPDFVGSLGYAIEKQTSSAHVKEIYDAYYNTINGGWTVNRVQAIQSIWRSISMQLDVWFPWIVEQTNHFLEASLTTPGLIEISMRTAFEIYETLYKFFENPNTTSDIVKARLDQAGKMLKEWISTYPRYLLPQLIKEINRTPTPACAVLLFSDLEWNAAVGFGFDQQITVGSKTEYAIFHLLLPRLLKDIMTNYDIDLNLRNSQGQTILEAYWARCQGDTRLHRESDELEGILLRYLAKGAITVEEIENMIRTRFIAGLAPAFMKCLGFARGLSVLVEHFRTKGFLLTHAEEDSQRLTFQASTMENDIKSLLWADIVRNFKIEDVAAAQARLPWTFGQPSWLVAFVKTGELCIPCSAGAELMREEVKKYVGSFGGLWG